MSERVQAEVKIVEFDAPFKREVFFPISNEDLLVGVEKINSCAE